METTSYKPSQVSICLYMYGTCNQPLAINVNQSRTTRSFVDFHRCCRRQRKQVLLLSLWNLKLREKLFYYKFALVFFILHKRKKGSFFFVEMVRARCQAKKAKIQFVIVGFIIKGKTLCKCAPHILKCTHSFAILCSLDSTFRLHGIHGMPSVQISVVFYRRNKGGYDTSYCNVFCDGMSEMQRKERPSQKWK